MCRLQRRRCRSCLRCRRCRSCLRCRLCRLCRILRYNSDGIELFFTNPETRISIKPSKKQSVETFLDAMSAVCPGETDPGTNLRPWLSKTTSGHHAPRGKRRTAFILTDGLWGGMPNEEDMEDWVKQNLCKPADHNPNPMQSPTRESAEKEGQVIFAESRPITLQFIALGHSKQGERRLRRLDNLMKDQGVP